MKVLLVEPPVSPFDVPTGLLGLPEPLALELIAAQIEPHHDVELLDMRLGGNLAQTLADFEPDVVATGCVTANMHLGKRILRQAKDFDERILTVVGGHHASMVPADFDQPDIDIIVAGEGDFSFAQIIQAHEGKRKTHEIPGLYLSEEGTRRFTGQPELVDLNSIPIPRRSLTANNRYRFFRGSWRPLTSIITSRGCPYRCEFCTLWVLNRGKYRTRRAELVVDEIASTDDEYIDFIDDNTLEDTKRSERICALLKERGVEKTYKAYGRPDTIVRRPDLIENWREVGLSVVLVGLESFRDEELQAWKKKGSAETNQKSIEILRQNDIELAAYFVVDPQFSKDDFRQLRDYVERLGLTHPVFTILSPFPGTELYRKRYSELVTHDYRRFDFFHTVLPTRLPIDEFYDEFAKLYAHAYSFGKFKAIESTGKVVSTTEQFDAMSELIRRIENLANDGIPERG